MRRLILFLAIAVGIISCTKPLEITEPEQQLYEFLGTEASEPLEGTIWEFNTGEVFNKYIAFSEGKASMFYGKTDENGVVDRWSPLYSNDYTYEKDVLTTSVSYPHYGETITSENVSVVKDIDAYAVGIDTEMYVFRTTDTECLEGEVMTIIAIIDGWIEDDEPDYPWR